MGGEYLPPLEDDEIEIAQYVYASVTQDVTSIRARRCGKRIRYPSSTRTRPEFNVIQGLVDQAADAWAVDQAD